MKILLLIFCTVFFFGCTQNSTPKKTKITLGAAASNYGGGIYILGRNTEGVMFSIYVNGDKEITLDNGKWTFLAVGWTGGYGKFTGTSKCAYSTKELEGIDTSISLDMSSSNCESSKFGPSNYKMTGGFKKIRPYSCSNFESIKNSLKNGSLTSCSNYPGNTQSFRIGLFNFEPTTSPVGGKNNPQFSACMTVGEISKVKIPAFGSDANFIFPVDLVGSEQPNCEGPQKVTHLSEGLASQNASVVQRPVSDNIKIFVSSDLCSNSMRELVPFANSDTNGAYVPPPGINYICTPEQFFALDDDPTYMSGNYELWDNIDLDGFQESDNDGDNQIFSSGVGFSGYLNGNYRAIMNYTKSSWDNDDAGLFALITEANIFNLTLMNFNLSDISGIGYAGILASTINSAGAGSPDDDETQINVSILNSTQSFPTRDFVGGLAGLINMANGDSDERTNISSYVNATITGNEYVGGIAGNITSDSMLEQLKIENSGISVTINAVRRAGGISGEVDNLNLLRNNIIGTTLNLAPVNDAELWSGGMFGQVTSEVHSMGNMITSVIVVDNTNSSYPDIGMVGGAVGFLNSGTFDGDHVYIASFDQVIDDGSATVSTVGGYVGYFYGLSNAVIKNINVTMISNLDGATHGGIAGLAAAGKIQGCMTEGMILEKSFNVADNNSRGGIIGDNQGAEISRSVSYLAVSGSNNIGGIAGSNSSIIDQVYAENNLTLSVAVSQHAAGGLVGSNSSNGNITNSIYMGGQIVSTDITYNCTNCGLLVGYNDQFNCGTASFGNLYGNASTQISDKDGVFGANDAVLGGYCLSEPTIFTTEVDCSNVEIDCSLFPGIWTEVDNIAKLTFFEDWKSVGFDAGKITGVGTNAAPITISNVSEWNNVAESAFLITKTIHLVNEIDFGNMAITPMGGNAFPYNKFTGTIVPNGNKLRNVLVDVTANDSNQGIFREAGDGNDIAQIGSFMDPLVVDGFEINLNSYDVSNAAVIGIANNVNLSVQVKNANIHQTGSPGTGTGIAGLVGFLVNARIENSSFQGDFNLVNYEKVGGLVGEMDGAAILDIHHSFVNANIMADNSLGGMIGSAAGVFKISDSYVRLGNVTINVGTDAGAIFGKSYTIADGRISTVFVDLINGGSPYPADLNMIGPFDTYVTINDTFIVTDDNSYTPPDDMLYSDVETTDPIGKQYASDGSALDGIYASFFGLGIHEQIFVLKPDGVLPGINRIHLKQVQSNI